MEIEEIIQLATKEFNTNGRSDSFIALENEVLESRSPEEIYYFARYAKGASAERLQDALIEAEALMEAYYFQKNVEGADIAKLVNLAIAKGDKFWCAKIFNLAKKSKQYNGIKHLFVGVDVKYPSKEVVKVIRDIDDLIEAANKEYAQAGRSEVYKEMEQCALHNDAPAYSYLFLKHVAGADREKFEYVTLLKGLPFSMFYIAIDIEDSSKALMLKGLERARLDYRKVEKGWKDIAEEKAKLEERLVLATSEEQKENLQTKLSLIPNKPAYLAKIDNDYIASVKYKIKHSAKTL